MAFDRRARSMLIGTALVIAAHAALGRGSDDDKRDGQALVEYATRWHAQAGGPASTADTLEVLSLGAVKQEVFSIQYFDLPGPALPEAKRILRQRVSKGEPEWTFKYRAGTPLPSSITACPLAASSKWKDEADVSVFFQALAASGAAPAGPARATASARSFSRSCSVKIASGKPVPLDAVARPCKSTMKRSKFANVNVEEWTLSSGGAVIEVSMKGPDNAATAAAFMSQVFKPLAALPGFAPESASKTEMGSDCK